MAYEETFTARQGSVMWGINTFRSFLLDKLLEDLARLEAAGLKPEQCELVQKCLRSIIQEFDKCPDKGFAKPILREQLIKFQEIYVKWNLIDGSTPVNRAHRKAELKKLRDRKRKISRKIGKRQREFSTEVDRQFFMTLWDNLATIPSQYPQEFKLLSVAIQRSRNTLSKAT
ncbi:MAG: hypothetical protein QOG71_2127 [Pyrinomonadaceae bacterium]|nr:hypothetical protein [Pyrinomonadaceae bacterium]